MDYDFISIREVKMRGIKWYMRHAWIRMVRLRNRIDAKLHHKISIILQVQNLEHTLNLNLNGGKLNGKINTR